MNSNCVGKPGYAGLNPGRNVGAFALLKEKQVQVGSLGGWRLGSIMRLGVGAAIAGLFFTEWTIVSRYIPFYNIKYANPDYEFLRNRDIAEAQAQKDKAEKAVQKEALMEQLGLK